MELHFEVENNPQNDLTPAIKNTPIGEGIFMVTIHNPAAEEFRLRREIDQSLIQFYFGLEGGATFLFNQGNYQLNLKKSKCLLFYNPMMALPLEIEIGARSKLVFLYITVEALHSLFVAESEEIAFLNKENIHKKYYAELPLSPLLNLTANQLFQEDVKGKAKEVFERAKAYEILALFFNKDEDKDIEQCPFLKDEENVERIRKAKKLVIEKMSDPLTLSQLAMEVGLNEYKLKEGFKNIYGKTVFQFLNDYRLDTARHFLDSGRKVNEAAFDIGYANPSHFIAAFRKKFGVTPKKYVSGKID